VTKRTADTEPSVLFARSICQAKNTPDLGCRNLMVFGLLPFLIFGFEQTQRRLLLGIE